MNTLQLNMFDLLEPKKKQQLCSSWLCALKNDCGVFTANTKQFIVGDKKKELIILDIALLYPYIYGTIGIETGAPFFYGSHSPLTEDSIIRLNVFDSEDTARMIMENMIYNRVERDGNLSIHQKERMYKLIDPLVENAMRGILNGN